MNRPFTATYTTITDEKTQSSTPTFMYDQNVLVTQDKHRKVYDSLITSITGNQTENYYPVNFSMPSQPQPTYEPNRPTCNFSTTNNNNYPIQAQKCYNPNGVTYTFNTCGCPCLRPSELPTSLNIQRQPMKLCSEINSNEIRLQRALEGLQFEQFMNSRPVDLRFHLDAQCSTSDLLDSKNQIPTSKGMPDFKNLSGIKFMDIYLEPKNCDDLRFPQPSGYNSWNHRQLKLKNCKTTKLESNIIDELARDKNKFDKLDSKQVRFSLGENESKVKESASKSVECQTEKATSNSTDNNKYKLANNSETEDID